MRTKFTVLMIVLLLGMTSCSKQKVNQVIVSPDGKKIAYLVEEDGHSAVTANIYSVYLSSSAKKGYKNGSLVFQGNNMDRLSAAWIGENLLKITFLDGYTNTYRNIWSSPFSDGKETGEVHVMLCGPGQCSDERQPEKSGARAIAR